MPPNLRLVVPSACWNASKISRCLSFAMPMPVSFTAKAMTPPAWSACGSRNRRFVLGLSNRERHAAFCVNLNAFESRFLSTCSTRCPSV